MLNIDEVNATIFDLENSNTTFANCQKLASLYIVRDHYNKLSKSVETVYNETRNDNVRKELSDILPQYRKYCEIKRKYQLNELTKDSVVQSVREVCKEINEFIRTLYSSTDMPEEREQIKNMILDLHLL